VSAPGGDVAPIRLTLELDVTPAEAWARFVEGFGEWWPNLTHSLTRDPGTRCVLEGHAGGRLYEVGPDGSEHDWGQVEYVRPAETVCFSWHPGREPESAQQIAVTFEATAGGCRVTLVHGNWEALGEIAPILRAQYVPGWQHVFGELFARYARRRH
jgi:hypothetical protein